jgi:uncharacterized protein
MAGMTVRESRWPAGVPCWADLTVPDVAAARRFYADVVGWSFAESGEEYGGYVIARAKGAAAAGIGPQVQPGQPAAWTLYIASDDVDTTAAAVAENGGTVLLPPGDVGPLGRMFIAADPTGAAFGVWQAGQHIGAEITNEPGGMTWEDLRSPDPDAARAFYTAVFGYETQPLADAGPDYHMFMPPGSQAPLGGMGGMFGMQGVPAHWDVYFSVPDTDAAVAAAEQDGGTVVSPARDSPYGRMAGVRDPFGATFSLAQLVPDAPQPER